MAENKGYIRKKVTVMIGGSLTQYLVCFVYNSSNKAQLTAIMHRFYKNIKIEL